MSTTKHATAAELAKRFAGAERGKPETNPIKRYYAKPTRKSAINAMCAHCMGCTSAEQGNGQEDHLERGFSSLIRDCSATGCPLYLFRPYQAKETK